jgi:hypothetical protein
MPDLDLIKQGNQGCGWFGEADPSISAGRRRLQPTRAILLLICCRSSKRPDGSSMNGCSPPRLPGVGPTTIQILPGCLVVGDTAEARQKRVLLDSLAHPDSGIASLSIAFGDDASGFDLDGPLPEIPESNASKGGRERFIECARRDNFTVRQLAQIAGSYGGLALVGRPAMIADQMEEWLYSEACDGFNIMSHMSGRPRRFRRPRRPRTAAPRPLPPRIRRQDPTREPSAPPPREPLLQQAKRLVEALVFDLPFRALAFAQLRGALFFGAPETNPIFLRLGLGLGAPALLAVLVKVDDHRL